MFTITFNMKDWWFNGIFPYFSLIIYGKYHWRCLQWRLNPRAAWPTLQIKVVQVINLPVQVSFLWLWHSGYIHILTWFDLELSQVQLKLLGLSCVLLVRSIVNIWFLFAGVTYDPGSCFWNTVPLKLFHWYQPFKFIC